ncbi:MAG: ArnT family glycosyltransferase [Syntrophorhabdaceae bacterium]
MDRKNNRADRTQVAFVILVILAACIFLFFLNLGGRDFWAPDEGDFAQIVKELDNNPVVPHLNNEPYGEKPPLFYYFVFACTKVFNGLRDETSMRLASAIAALGMIVAFFFTCLKNFDLRRAIVSVIVLGLAPLFYWQARYLQVDMVFATFLCISLFAFFAFTGDGAKVWYYVFFVSLACAFMTKGPLAIILAVPVVIAYCLTEKKVSMLLSRHTVFGTVLFFAMIIPWYSAVYMKEGLPYLYENILRQNFLRFFEAWSHKRPFYYYFTTLPLDFFPWSAFLPLALYTAFKTFGSEPKVRFFLIWFVWFFFFLSLSSGKISKYMLPALPALAVLVSGVMEKRTPYNRVVYAIIGGLFCLIGIFLIVYKPSLYAQLRPERVIIAIPGIILGILIFAAVKYRSAKTALTFVAVFLASAYMVGNISIFEKWNVYKSPRPISEKIRERAGDRVPWVYYGSMRGVYVYYVGRFAVHIEEHDTADLKLFAGKTPEFYLLTRARDAGEVKNTVPGVAIDTQDQIGDTSMVLFHYKKGNG